MLGRMPDLIDEARTAESAMAKKLGRFYEYVNAGASGRSVGGALFSAANAYNFNLFHNPSSP